MKTNSTISAEILDFIPYPESQIPDNRLADNINAEKFTDVLLGIGELKIVSEEVAFEQLRTIEAIDDPELKGMVMAGIGGVQTYIGNYVKASCAFRRALELARSPEAIAFVYSEMSNLLRKLGHRDSAVTILDESLENCANERLVWQLKWQRALCYKYTHPELALEMLTEVADHYDNRHHLLNLARMKRHIGNIHGHLQDYDKGHSCYNEAMEIAVQLDAPHLQYEILNDRGWMWCQQGKYEKARSLFLELLKEDLWPYEMALALQNLGVLEYSRERFRDAIHFHSQSLQLTTQDEMWELAIEDYYKLGLCHEKLGLTGLANHFFSLGYQLVMEEAELGLPMMDYRKKVVDSYVELLKRTQKVSPLNVRDELFGFSTNRSLKQIRDIFHKSLLSLHLERTRNAPELCRRLGITTRTYFLYQKKLRLGRGSREESPLYENPHFTQYVESLAALPWREVNRRFDDDLFSFLLEKHDFNRRRLAEVLGVSYAQVAMKTQGAEG